MSDFKAGDVVQLKSGGPLMTVSEVYQTEFLECIWFPHDGDVARQTFNKATLNKS